MYRFHIFVDANSHVSLFADADTYFLPMPIPADADFRFYVKLY